MYTKFSSKKSQGKDHLGENVRTILKRMTHKYNVRVITAHPVYCAGDEMEKNEMGWACGAYGRGKRGV